MVQFQSDRVWQRAKRHGEISWHIADDFFQKALRSSNLGRVPNLFYLCLL